MQTEQTHSIHIPDTATKQLAIQSCSAGRKLTVSTNRCMSKDSVVIRDGDHYLFPDVELMKTLMQIPSSFSTDAVSLSVASEIIGQSVDYGMHHRITQSIKRHIELVSASLKGRQQLSMALSA